MTMHVREGNNDRLFEVENADCPSSLSKHGVTRSGQKPALVSCMGVDCPSDFDEAGGKLIYGARMVHVLRPDASVAPTFVTSTTFVTAHQFCQFISTTFVNSGLTSFVSNINHLCRYRRGHYFCQQDPTTLVNCNCMILPMCAMLSHTLK